MIKVTKESFYKTIMTARAYNMKRREVDHTEPRRFSIDNRSNHVKIIS